ncbi:MAG: LPS assembly protein LptD [Terracidiphilus sp.]
MHPRNFVFITLLVLCHLQVWGQVLTNALPGPAYETPPTNQPPSAIPADPLPDDPGQEILPVAQPEPAPLTGVPVRWEAGRQTRVGDTWTLTGGVVVHYRDYILSADRVVYHQSTTELEADGHLQVAGGPDDVVINATNGEMRLNTHTARFFNVTGSTGVRRSGRTVVYSTPNPFLFSGKVLLQTGEGSYRIVDGTMTNCRLPHPDWQLIAHAIKVANGNASTSNTFFKLLGIPIFYLPYLRHPVEENGRESGLLVPVISNSSIKGFTFGEQVYVALNRSMDMVIGSEFYSKRGFAPNGDFRYKGPGLDYLTVRWNALLDRGIAAIPPATGRVNQGGVDIGAMGRQDITPNTRVAGNVEYLSSYVYRLIFNDNYSQAVNSEVASSLSLTHTRSGFMPSLYMGRFQTFASSAPGDEARILHLPSLRFDVLDRPLVSSPFYWGFGSSISRLSRAEAGFNAHNVGRTDIYPHLSLPLVGDGWSVVPEVAVRNTSYSGSQVPDLTGANGGTPYLSHDPLNRSDFEASIDVRPPALERDFTLSHWNRELRHLIEPEFTYKYVSGIGSQARNVLLVDTSDIATNTNEVGFSLTQRFYLRPLNQEPCSTDDTGSANGVCTVPPREWASWQIAQKFFIDPNFGGALIPDRRNVFDSTLDLSGIAFLTVPRNLSPITSRLRFEAINNLRIEWDMDYDPRGGRLGADNLYAGYSFGRTTVGLGHALLNAVDEQGSAATTIQSQQLQPFLQIGKPTGTGFNLAANGGYDFVHGELQYAGVQAMYNWDCCGLSIGYRRFQLGTVGSVSRDETQYLYSFTLANFGSVGDIRHTNSVFRDPTQPPAY